VEGGRTALPPLPVENVAIRRARQRCGLLGSRSSTAKVSLAAVATVLLTGIPADGAGQVLRGRLLDLDTNQPITGGVVTLARNGREWVVSVVTGDDGSYRLAAPGPGSYLVEARRLGYRAWIDGPVELRAGDRWESEYRLQALPIPLDPVGVKARNEARDPLLERVGFYERQRADFGHFVTRAQIAARDARRVTDLLAAIPGVRILPSSTGLSRAGIDVRGSVLSRGGACHPRVFVDGLMVIRGDARPRGTDLFGQQATEVRGDPAERLEIALNDVVMPQDIEALEVYRSATQVPVRFGGSGTATQCGAIVIWTRRGQPAGP
jgi:hypothetical protein